MGMFDPVEQQAADAVAGVGYESDVADAGVGGTADAPQGMMEKALEGVTGDSE